MYKNTAGIGAYNYLQYNMLYNDWKKDVGWYENCVLLQWQSAKRGDNGWTAL